MQRTAAIGTAVVRHRQHRLDTGEMRWQRCPMGLLGAWLRRLRRPGIGNEGFSPSQVGLEILQAERHLVRIEPFRATAELCPQKLLDDRPQTLDFDLAFGQGAVTACDSTSQVAHQLMQQIDVGR